MKKYLLYKNFILIGLLGLTTLHIQAQGTIDKELAKEKIEYLYRDLDTYVEKVYNHKEKSGFYREIEKRIIDAVTNNCYITNDIIRIDGERTGGSIEFESYLKSNLYKTAMKNIIVFSVNCNDMKYNSQREIGTASNVILRVTSIKNSYQCVAEITFKGEKIDHIIYSDFKLIDDIHVPTPKRIGVAQDPYMYFSAGYGWQGIHLGVGTGGLSDNWFFSRVKIGMEMNMKRSNYEHYPTSSEGLPATKTYHQNKYDVAGGLQIGYMIIPGRETEWDIEEGLSLSALLGFGGIFYDWWSEKTEQSSIIKHGPSQAFYIKPSLRFDWAYWGIEAGYYFSPKESPIRGTTFRLIINIPL